MATDNSVLKAALYKGNSSSEKLFDLIVRLRIEELKHSCKLIATHVSGNRMMAQGTDRLSGGSLREGVAVGKEMLTFCPWAKSALDINENLLSWVKTCAPRDLRVLKPADWFVRGYDTIGGYRHSSGTWYSKYQQETYLPPPPPAATDACLEELRKARMKIKKSLHIIII